MHRNHKSGTQKQLKLVPYNDYISKEGIKGLTVLEGHNKTEKVLNKATGKYEVTGLCGIKQSCIDEVKRYTKQQGFDITEEMSKVKTPYDLTEKTAEQFVGYFAWRNHNLADKHTNNKFSELDQHKRDVLLSYFHNMSLEKLAKNKGKKGSILDAIELGDTDEVIKRLFQKSDGTYTTYEDAVAKDRRGLMNRLMATSQWYYNPYAEVVSSFANRDKAYRDEYTQPGKLDTIIKAAENMQAIRKKNRNININNDYDIFSEETEQAIAEPKQLQEKSFLQKLGELGMAIINPMYGMVNSAMQNQVANNSKNILKENKEAK